MRTANVIKEKLTTAAVEMQIYQILYIYISIYTLIYFYQFNLHKWVSKCAQCWTNISVYLLKEMLFRLLLLSNVSVSVQRGPAHLALSLSVSGRLLSVGFLTMQTGWGNIVSPMFSQTSALLSVCLRSTLYLCGTAQTYCPRGFAVEWF